MSRVVVAGADERALDLAERAIGRGDEVLVVGDPPRPQGTTGRRLAALVGSGAMHAPRADVIEIVCDDSGRAAGVVIRERRDGAVVFEPASVVVVADTSLTELFLPEGGGTASLVAVHAALRAGASIREPARCHVDPITFEALGDRGTVPRDLVAAGGRIFRVDANDTRTPADVPQADRHYLAFDDVDAPEERPHGRTFLDLSHVARDAPARRALDRSFDRAKNDDVVHLAVAPALRGAGGGLDRFEEIPDTVAMATFENDVGDARASEIARALETRLARAREGTGESCDEMLASVKNLVGAALLPGVTEADLAEARRRLDAIAQRIPSMSAFDAATTENRSIVGMLAVDAAVAIAEVLVAARGSVAPSAPPATESPATATADVVAAAIAGAGTNAPTPRPVRIDVTRRDHPEGATRRESFEITLASRATVHEALVAIARKPTTVEGRRVDPVAWDAPCVAERCGRCTVLVNGQARLACSTAIDDVSPKGRPIRLAPLGKVPTIRDLVVDLEAVPRLTLPMATGTTAPATPVVGADEAPHDAIAACIGCGACYEACPETSPARAFVGPAELAAAHVASRSTTDAARARIFDDAAATGGVAECAKAETCVDVCPVDVPVFEAILALHRDTTRHVFRRR